MIDDYIDAVSKGELAAYNERLHERLTGARLDAQRLRRENERLVCGRDHYLEALDSEWCEVSSVAPVPHTKYLVHRAGWGPFVATPCYGMHEPWWVPYAGEAEPPYVGKPTVMRDDDLWTSWDPRDDLPASMKALADEVGRLRPLLAAMKNVEARLSVISKDGQLREIKRIVYETIAACKEKA